MLEQYRESMVGENRFGACMWMDLWNAGWTKI